MTDAAGDAVETNATDASGGTKTGHIRWMLVAGLVLVVIALGAAWLVFSSSHPHPQPAATSQAAAAQSPFPAAPMRT